MAVQIPEKTTNKPLRIVQVALTLEIGGLETLIIELSKQLVQKKIHVEIICLSSIDTDYVASLRAYEIPVHVFTKKHRLDFGFFLRVAHFIREKRFDVVHAHSGCFLYAALFRQISGVGKYIYTAHGMPINNGLRARVEDIISALMTDCVVSVSHELEAHLKKWLIVKRCCYETIINGVNTAKFKTLPRHEKKMLLHKYKFPRGQFIIGTVGRLEPVKNYKMLLQAFAELQKESIKNIHLVIVGEGNQKDVLIHFAEELRVLDEVHFLGMQYDVHEILPLFDVFALSSLTEGTSISLLESQACGVPAVVTDVGGNGFVITHGENGFLCPLNDYKRMAQYILKVITNEDEAFLLKKNARNKIEYNFSITSMAKKYEQLYRKF